MDSDNENNTHAIWNHNAPEIKDVIKEIFNDLKNKFGFQKDSKDNIFDQLISELNSLSGRMSPFEALSTLYAKYIGENSSYRKWYLALDIGGTEEQTDTKSNCPKDMIYQLALWKLLWGEASLVRFKSECLHFIFMLANDYNKGPLSEVKPVSEEDYLENVITPIYDCYIRYQGYIKNEKDHAEIIGYDDINQLFWCRETIYNITLKDKKSRIMDEYPTQRYLKLRDVQWDHVFVKKYKEKRTWFHLAVNFTRLWIIHAVAIWYTACYVFFLYNNNFESAVQWSVLAFGGAISAFIMFIGRIGEFLFVPLRDDRTSVLIRQLLFLFILFIIHSASTYYIIMNSTSPTSLLIGMVQFVISLITTLGFAIIPSSYLFGDSSREKAFTANYTRLGIKDRVISIGFWCFVLISKFLVLYFLSHIFKHFLEATFKMRVSDSSIHSLVLILAIISMFSGYLMLLFSDTYFWYIIWGMIFTVVVRVVNSFWNSRENNSLNMLPKNICKKILASNDTENDMKVNVPIIWNKIVTYMEHHLSINDLKNLSYVKQENGSWKPPPIFANHDGEQYFSTMSEEAIRRIKSFAQSFSDCIPDPLPIKKMPAFTVLTPQFSEKILLPFSEINENNTRINLLECLKGYNPSEWDNFSSSSSSKNYNTSNNIMMQEYLKNQDRFSDEDDTLRIRIWASLRTQTLFRTISGFMNYSKVIKILYHIQNPDIVASCSNNINPDDEISNQKFRFLISLQKYNNFNKEEKDDVDFLLRIYPDLKIAYLEEEKNKNKTKFFSVLIDGHCQIKNGKRMPIYRIRLPGDPILGDGKGDNQNHAIIFYRGEYIQVIDANQDNYFEECLKISNVLREFEGSSKENPVTIVGTREYVFSKNHGVIGDVIAGKGEAFGVMIQPIMAELNGRLHYGHPDFFDAAFTVTRGGLSKAQKGLHLSEDIYAGMTSFNRGGRIKYCDYIQCGKGRDVGLESVLCFTIKTSNGMGEQLLSREYYYFGTQLSLDRLLTFYYAHTAFHVNHVTITLSVELLIFGLMFIGAMGAVFPVCDNTSQNVPCFDVIPIIDCIKWPINFIFFKSFVDLLPSYTQDLIEKGFVFTVKRLGKHFISLSPFFEVFNVQIYADSMMKNLSSGGAHYIASYRGFATERIPFSNLYLRYSEQIYRGIKILIVVVFVFKTIWIPHLMYLLFLALALCFSPFLFNPHQFSFSEFVNDYHKFLTWMYLETTDTEKNEQLTKKTEMVDRFKKARDNSWIDYCRTEKLGEYALFPHFNDIITSFVFAVLGMIIFMFIKMNDSVTSGLPNNGSKIIIYMSFITIEPVLMNLIALVGLRFVSYCIGPPTVNNNNKFEIITRSWAIINTIGSFEFLWIMESKKLENAISGVIALLFTQIFLFNLIINWYGSGSTTTKPTKPFLKHIIKLIEMLLFAKDFILGHILLFPLSFICLIPRIDDLHFIILYWLKPNEKIRVSRILRERKIFYVLLFITLFFIFMGLIIGPIIIRSLFLFNSNLVGIYFAYFNIITFLTFLTFYAS